MYLLPNSTMGLASSTLGVWINGVAQISGVTIKTNASTLYTSYEAWLFANMLNPVDLVGVATASCPAADVFTNTTATDQLSQAMSRMGISIGQ